MYAFSFVLFMSQKAAPEQVGEFMRLFVSSLVLSQRNAASSDCPLMSCARLNSHTHVRVLLRARVLVMHSCVYVTHAHACTHRMMYPTVSDIRTYPTI